MYHAAGCHSSPTASTPTCILHDQSNKIWSCDDPYHNPLRNHYLHNNHNHHCFRCYTLALVGSQVIE